MKAKIMKPAMKSPSKPGAKKPVDGKNLPPWLKKGKKGM